MEAKNKNRWPGYPKEVFCPCGSKFIAKAPHAVYCQSCVVKRKKAAVKRFQEKNLYKKPKHLDAKKMLAKPRNQMNMADHWLKSFFLENLKTMGEREALDKAIKKVQKIQLNNWRKVNNMHVYLTAKERKALRENSKRWFNSPYDAQTQHEEEVLIEYGYLDAPVERQG